MDKTSGPFHLKLEEMLGTDSFLVPGIVLHLPKQTEIYLKKPHWTDFTNDSDTKNEKLSSNIQRQIIVFRDK